MRNLYTWILTDSTSQIEQLWNILFESFWDFLLVLTGRAWLWRVEVGWQVHYPKQLSFPASKEGRPMFWRESANGISVAAFFTARALGAMAGVGALDPSWASKSWLNPDPLPRPSWKFWNRIQLNPVAPAVLLVIYHQICGVYQALDLPLLIKQPRGMMLPGSGANDMSDESLNSTRHCLCHCCWNRTFRMRCEQPWTMIITDWAQH